jgi:hypothetical protein
MLLIPSPSLGELPVPCDCIDCSYNIHNVGWFLPIVKAIEVRFLYIYTVVYLLYATSDKHHPL